MRPLPTSSRISNRLPLWLRHTLGLCLLLATSIAAAGEFGQGLFWRIDPPSGAAPSHIYGTVHVDDSRALKLAPVVMETLAKSRLLALELVTDADSAEAFAAAAQLPEERRLNQLMPAQDYALIEDILRNRYGIPPYVVERMAPWSAYVTLNLPGPRMGLTVDELLHRMALKQSKPVEGLETVQAQIAAMQAIPEPQQIALLVSAAREHDRVLEMVRALIERYLREDLDGILSLQDRFDESLSAEIQAAQDALVESVLLRRNPGMAEKAAGFADGGAAFLAVGALHLQGPRGVLAELQKRGYRVTRVPLTRAP